MSTNLKVNNVSKLEGLIICINIYQIVFLTLITSPSNLPREPRVKYFFVQKYTATLTPDISISIWHKDFLGR